MSVARTMSLDEWFAAGRARYARSEPVAVVAVALTVGIDRNELRRRGAAALRARCPSSVVGSLVASQHYKADCAALAAFVERGTQYEKARCALARIEAMQGRP